MAGRLRDRIALVTGASRGIGAAVARRYAAEGAQVILVARTVGGLEEVDDQIKADLAAAGSDASRPGATLVPLDLTEFDNIDQLGAALHERFGRLDILVANAGVLGVLTPVTHMDPDVWQQVIDTNLTATWRLIRSMHPLLQAADAGRAIFVTSGVTQDVFAYWGAYAASKAALETLALTYAAECETTNIRANIVDPGQVRTAMRATAFPNEDPNDLPHPDQITDVFVELADTASDRNGERVRAPVAPV